MPESLMELFSPSFFMPHGHCYLWRPGLVVLQVLSNGLIGLAYLSISTTLAYLVYQLRDELPFRWMYLAFGAFIVLCGFTHFFDIVVIWRPIYWVDGSLRALTAIVSVLTAILLPPLIPHAITLARGVQAAFDRGIKLETAVADLSTMYRKTKELEQLKSQFFANVSHELRTPLALILGPVEKLLRGQELAEGPRRDLAVVLRNARTLHRHVDDLLDAARLDAGQLKPAYVQTDLSVLVRLTAAHFDALAVERGVALSVEAPPELSGEVDANKFQRVVLNLVGNAFKFTPPQGRIRCTLAAVEAAGSPSAGGEAPARDLVLTVADSGPGIPPEFRQTVFERFRQLDGTSTRQVGGIGLGLAISKEFVELHGGRISVSTAEEGGALFRVQLPLTAPRGASVREASEETGGQRAALVQEALEELRARVQVAPGDPDRSRSLVLVAEDNLDMNRFVCEILAAECRTEPAFDGQTALDRALELHPDLILSDIMMPQLSGEQLVRQVRAHPQLARVPIILLTAKADDELRIKLLREGAQDYVSKPFSPEELRARVGNLLTMKRAQDVLEEARIAAETASTELEAFSDSVSHDLRAPLRWMDGFSQALLDYHAGQLDAKGQGFVRNIRDAAGQMTQRIDALLDLARVSRSELRATELDLAPLARRVLARLGKLHPERQVDAVIPDRLPARGDPPLIEALLENLLGNAWKFTGQRPRARIELGCEPAEGGPVFFVRDDGAGFDMAHSDKLFRPFQRLHPEQQFPGTGIGLATVHRIVRRHKGRVWAESAVDRGTTLRFTLQAPV